MKREHWKSRFGFIWAAVGSAVGLGSIWRFPYVVGNNGGAAFILVYLVCLILVGFPVLLSELLIGRTTQKSPAGAFSAIGKTKTWKVFGVITICTGFLVSSFYGVIAGTTFGYLIEGLLGKLTHFSTANETLAFYDKSSASPLWMMLSYTGFVLISMWILITGVRKGIEAGNKVMMPLLFFVLLFLVFFGISFPGSGKGLKFLFNPNFRDLTPAAIIIALGQAFFATSLGQGTMVTYGSYLKKSESLPSTCVPISVFSTIVSLLAGMAIFSIVFSVGVNPGSGASLMFQTLPLIFSKMTGGYMMAFLFFLLLFLAGITSQISALEPVIAFLMDEWKWKRHHAVVLAASLSYLLGIPCALSFGLLKNFTIFHMTVFEFMEFMCVNILIPLGGFVAVILVGWRLGINKAFDKIKEGTSNAFSRYPFIGWYIKVSIKYIAPILILFILLDLFGVFK
ncbi:MAG: hypothetical protein S4CHLAM37_07200 [Chlamydiia bacterium]|nr:hypothetical protein [Chlamydiia bacterium]